MSPLGITCYSKIYWEEKYIDKACFTQDTKYHRFFDEVVSVTQNLTVQNPISIGQVNYNCVIDGDGTTQHFGPTQSYTRPRLDVFCSRSEFSSTN